MVTVGQIVHPDLGWRQRSNPELTVQRIGAVDEAQKSLPTERRYPSKLRSDHASANTKQCAGSRPQRGIHGSDLTEVQRAGATLGITTPR